MWEYVEADFRRDYGIDLTRELPDMSWRQFQTLLNGLNPYGSVASHYDSALKEQESTREKTEDEKRVAANSFWASVASI